jgi:hypothetical protein
MKKTELQKRYIKNQIKTTEGEFLYALRTSYEFSPKVCESILYTAKIHLLRDKVLKEGQIEITVIGIEERSGKFIEMMEKKRVILTIENGMEDIQILKQYGRLSLRQVQIQRITDEAIEQEGVMSQEDLARVLRCDTRTIQRDISSIKKRGIDVITRGVLHNIGRGQTHKVKIIGMYLDGSTYSEIRLKTRHSLGAIKRYMESFVKVLAANHYGIRAIKTVSTITGISENLVNQYIELIRTSKGDNQRREMMKEMTQSWIRSEELKKRMLKSGYRAVVTVGGVI